MLRYSRGRAAVLGIATVVLALVATACGSNTLKDWDGNSTGSGLQIGSSGVISRSKEFSRHINRL